MNTHAENNRDDDGYLTNDADGRETHTILALTDGNQTQPPQPRAATTDPAHTAPASPSQHAEAQPRALKQRRKRARHTNHTKKNKNGRTHLRTQPRRAEHHPPR